MKSHTHVVFDVVDDVAFVVHQVFVVLLILGMDEFCRLGLKPGSRDRLLLMSTF